MSKGISSSNEAYLKRFLTTDKLYLEGINFWAELLTLDVSSLSLYINVCLYLYICLMKYAFHTQTHTHTHTHTPYICLCYICLCSCVFLCIYINLPQSVYIIYVSLYGSILYLMYCNICASKFCI